MDPRRTITCLVALTLLAVTESGSSQALTDEPSASAGVEAATRALQTELQALHENYPEYVPLPQSRENGALLISLYDSAARLGEARFRVALGISPGEEHEISPDDAMVDWARERYRDAKAHAENVIGSWANATLHEPGHPSLEDAWAVTQSAFHIVDAELFLERVLRAQNASSVLILFRGVEANLALLDALAPIRDNLPSPERALKQEDVATLRQRVRYSPDTLDGKVRDLDHRARTELSRGEFQLALAYTLSAEVANTNRRAYDAAFTQEHDLLPTMRAERQRWIDAPPSLLLLHAHELGDAVVAAAPENASAAASNLGIAAAEALARYSGVALLRVGENTGEASDTIPGQSAREAPWPMWSPVAVLSLLAFAAHQGRVGRKTLSAAGAG